MLQQPIAILYIVNTLKTEIQICIAFGSYLISMVKYDFSPFGVILILVPLSN